MSSEDRRGEPRQTADAPVYLMWHEGDSSHSARGSLVESSTRGLSFQTAARIRPGSIVYCAVPSHGICSRVQICHTRRELFRTVAGGRLLATF